MSDTEEFTKCIGCKSSLLYKPLEDWMNNFNLDLPYCPNSKCLRYGLFTLEDDELTEATPPKGDTAA